jgi:hypothetical protein
MSLESARRVQRRLIETPLVEYEVGEPWINGSPVGEARRVDARRGGGGWVWGAVFGL